MGMTITEKICARAAGKDRVGPGDMIDAEIDKLYIKDLRFSKAEDPKGLYGLFKEILKEMGIHKAWDPDKIIINFDEQPARSTETAGRSGEGQAIFPGAWREGFIKATMAASVIMSWSKKAM